MPPAYIFYGADGIGKKMVAVSLACFCFCKQTKKGPCGTCLQCVKVEKNRHPDFFLVEPPEGKTTKIDEIRRLQKAIAMAPLEAPLKIAIIDGANRMTLQAANSLLKTLEEPPKNTLFILVTPNLFSIIPTIRSRCRSLFFRAPPLDETSERLAVEWRLPSSRVRELLEFSDGSPGMALRINEPVFMEAIHETVGLFTDAKFSFADLNAVAQSLVEKEIDLPIFLETIKKKYLWPGAQKQDWNCLEKMSAISRAQRDLAGNVNKTLVLENLFMDISGK